MSSRTGPGRPVAGTSWRNRPWYLGGFFGPMFGDDPIDGVLEQDVGTLGGARFGYDLDYYFAAEATVALAIAAIDDGQTPPPGRDGETVYLDGRMLLYPWGDSQWRPFASIGLGLQTFRFHDDADERIHESLLSMPIGIGLKFFHSPYHTLRLEAYDNIGFGDGKLSAMQNFTLAAGVEFRFGGRPTSYFPWHGSTSYW